ncbi:hypothetical protein EJ03DRAFT_322874 [Teratosphaeria nubilosa]|uniref:Piwi domain-containing protein n=1 Tax=Teratosphaeria nubilosa TaxID=161662 RepID=A0A6G1LMW0_9PEZI|nr:hypothetical protein EJ03DRAFT_322874 [Teratosphaeria nubilosa]
MGTVASEPPARILYYRDGVSESQYHEIRRVEKRAIRRAGQEVAKAQQNTPLITAVVVTERHQAALAQQALLLTSALLHLKSHVPALCPYIAGTWNFCSRPA